MPCCRGLFFFFASLDRGIATDLDGFAAALLAAAAVAHKRATQKTDANIALQRKERFMGWRYFKRRLCPYSTLFIFVLLLVAAIIILKF
jgi:hypothetical protein